jgi:hypothetical protein
VRPVLPRVTQCSRSRARCRAPRDARPVTAWGRAAEGHGGREAAVGVCRPLPRPSPRRSSSCSPSEGSRRGSWARLLGYFGVYLLGYVGADEADEREAAELE